MDDEHTQNEEQLQSYQGLLHLLNSRHVELLGKKVEVQTEEARVAQVEASNLALTAVVLKYRLQDHANRNRVSRSVAASSSKRTVLDMLNDVQQQTTIALMEAEEVSKDQNTLTILLQRLSTVDARAKAFPESIVREVTCGICFSQCADFVIVPCGHTFCSECVKTFWGQELARQATSCFCPLCQVPIEYGLTVPVHAIHEVFNSVQADEDEL